MGGTEDESTMRALAASADVRACVASLLQIVRQQQSEIDALHTQTRRTNDAAAHAELLARCFDATRALWDFDSSPPSLLGALDRSQSNSNPNTSNSNPNTSNSNPNTSNPTQPTYAHHCRILARMYEHPTAAMPLRVALEAIRTRADAEIDATVFQRVIDCFERAMDDCGVRRKSSSPHQSTTNSAQSQFSGKRTPSLDISKKTNVWEDLFHLIIDLDTNITISFCNSMKPTDVEESVKHLVDLFMDQNIVYPLLFRAINDEIENTASSTSLFRGNDYRSRMILYYIFATSQSYLAKVLQDPVKSILGASGSLEVDPTKIREDQDITVNQRTLAQYSQSLLQLILLSIPEMPEPIKIISRYIHDAVARRFPDAARSAVIVLIFLRVFGPCITLPSKVGIQVVPDSQGIRSLVLIMKVLQNLANGLEWGDKEAYMIPMNGFIRRNQSLILAMFDQIVDVNMPPPSKAPHKPVYNPVRDEKSIKAIHAASVGVLDSMGKFICSTRSLSNYMDDAHFPIFKQLCEQAPITQTPVRSISSPRATSFSEASRKKEEEEKGKKVDIFKRFHVEDTALVEFNCCLERKVPLHGKLYVCTTCICFYSQVFGFKTKEVIAFSSIASIERSTTSSGGLDIIRIGEKPLSLGSFSSPEKALDTLLKQLSEAKRKPASLQLSFKPKVSEDQEEHMLSGADWQIFQEGAKSHSFAKNQAVLQEGSRSGSLYHIGRGSLRVEKLKDGLPMVLGRMSAGEMFGEMSFLEGNVASASVIADEDAEVYVISGTFVDNLLKAEPELAGRFYHFLACNLSRRLRKLAPKRSARSTSDSQDVSQHKMTNEKFQRIFQLPETEVLLYQYPATLKKKLDVHGWLLISSSYMCFYAKLIGVTVKEMCQLREVVDLQIDGERIDVKINEKNSYEYTVERGKISKDLLAHWARCRAQTSTPARVRPSSRTFDEGLDILTEDDWTQLLQGASEMRPSAGQAIVREGHSTQFVYQVARGQVRVERMHEDGHSQILRVLGESELFAEMAFLEGAAASASVIADDPQTMLYAFDVQYLRRLLANNPFLPSRLYKHLATIIARRLRG